MSIRHIKIPTSEASNIIEQQIKKGHQLILMAQSKNESRDNFEIKFKQWVNFTGEILKESFVSSVYASDFKEHRSSKVEYVSSSWIPDIEYYIEKLINPKLDFLRILKDNMDEFIETSNKETYDNRIQMTEEKVMTDEEIELEILKKYVAQHEVATIADTQLQNKCARELDMREVLRGFIVCEDPSLEYQSDLWLQRLAPFIPGGRLGPLRRCSNAQLNMNTHLYHARAYVDQHQKIPDPAWERIRKLKSSIPQHRTETPRRELEQKFKILYSAPQAQKDYDGWRSIASKDRHSIAILFIDIDYFKKLNTKYTETEVDKSILLEAQYLLKRLTSERGGAYRHGGDEFLVILPNHDNDEAMFFGEKLRRTFENHDFYIGENKEKLTISVGVALIPDHGKNYDDVLKAANEAKQKAKANRNKVILAH